MAHRISQRPLRWNGRECILPALPNLADIHKLTPLELEARASSIPKNKGADFSEKTKSCLTIMFIAYLAEAGSKKLYNEADRKRMIDDFKNSPDWPAVLQNHAPAPPKRRSGSQTKEAWAPRAPASTMLWKMPDAPTWEIREMTFQKFVDVFNEKNSVDNFRGFEPWESVMTFFKDYVARHYTSEAGQLGVLKHVWYALKNTKLERNIPGPVLAKHLRRLEADKLQETIADSRKRARYGGDDDGGPSSSAKRIKVEEDQRQLPARSATNGSTLLQKASHTRQATSGSVGPNNDGIHPSHSQLVPNPTLGPPKGGVNGALVTSRPTLSASPAPSATAWLQANLPNGPGVIQKPINSVPGTNVSAVPSLPVGSDGHVLARPDMRLDSTPGAMPSPTLASHNATKSLIKMEALLEGVMEDLNELIAKAKEPETTEVLTEDQQHLLGKLSYSHKSVMKELKALQKSLNG